MTETAAELLRTLHRRTSSRPPRAPSSSSPGCACPAAVALRDREQRRPPARRRRARPRLDSAGRGAAGGVRPARRGRVPPPGDGGAVRARAAGGERPLRLRRRRPRRPPRRLGRRARGVVRAARVGGVAAGPQGLRGAAPVDEVGGRRSRSATGSAAAPLLAAGDSLLDADLLDVADAAIRPAHGELAEAGFTRDHLTVTDTTGVRAGEEMLAWMHARTTATTRRTTPSWRCGTS